MTKRYYQYVSDVADKKILTCKKIQQAIKRFKNDLKASKKADFPYTFNEKKADRVISFIEALKHFEGQYAGKPIVLENWQTFIIANLYGWVKKTDGTRRFKKAYIQVARKNGKTILMSALALYDVLTEPGGQAVSGATRRDQAAISFNNVVNFIKQNSSLRELVSLYRTAVVNPKLSSKFEALSSEADKFDGLNPSLAIIDECAAQTSSTLVDVIQSGMYSRKEALLLEITTASSNLQSLGKMEYDAASKLLADITKDETYFTIIYELDDKDDWKNDKIYLKANPNLDVSVSLENLTNARDEAMRAPYKETEFRTKNLNQWMSTSSSWIQDKYWQRCIKSKKDIDLSNLLCVGAIDLSKRVDFTAYTKYFYEPKKKKFIAKHQFYIPEGQIEEKMKSDTLQIKTWINLGLIKATPGETVDYNYLYKDVADDLKNYKLTELAYDSYMSGGLEDKFSELITMVPVPQGTKLSVPAKDWEAAILSGELIDDNPVMRWMVSNAEVRYGATGLMQIVKPETNKNSKRIDGVITSIMAHTRLLANVMSYDPRSAEDIEKELEKSISTIDY